MDPVATYGGTSRELVLGFRVVSDDRSEAVENMIKIEKLIQYQYPTYQTAGGGGARVLNSPPYFELVFMNVLDSSRKNGSVLTGYINGAIQINPGFQAKEQSQFFSPGFDKLYFSDVTITLRMQVLHEGEIGWIGGNFSHQSYPYNIGADDIAPEPSVSTIDAQEIAAQTAANANSAVNGVTPQATQNAKNAATKAANLNQYRPQPYYRGQSVPKPTPAPRPQDFTSIFDPADAEKIGGSVKDIGIDFLRRRIN